MRSAQLLALCLCLPVAACSSGGTAADAAPESDAAVEPSDGTGPALDRASTPLPDGAGQPDATADAPAAPCTIVGDIPDLPQVLDCTTRHPNPRVIQLVRRATSGLGFPGREGPRREDLIFVGDQVMGWIDRTGFFGKLNGLWALDGAVDALDFSLVEPAFDGSSRPVNMLLPGEDGDGRWPNAYNGAEHYEIPRYRDGAHVAQAGLREANHFAPSAPTTWSQCVNANRAPERWDEQPGSNELLFQSDGTVLVTNRAPLVIVARFGASAYPCGSPFPFNNTLPGRMDLTSGYIFHPRSARIDRIYKLSNLSAHDYSFQTSVDKLIGGFLLTDWPKPHYLKQLHLFGSWTGDTLVREERFPYLGTGQGGDHIEVRASGQRWLSATPTPVAGRSIRIEQAAGLGDVGTCLCRVHGGFELGGAVLARLQLPAPVAPATATDSPVHTRSLFLDGDRSPASAPAIASHRLDGAEENPALHQVGAREGTAWVAASPAAAGLLYYGKYIPAPARAVGQAAFALAIDPVEGPDEIVLTIDLVHAGSNVIARRDLRRSDFRASGQLQKFVLDFQVPADGNIEPRVNWPARTRALLEGVMLNWIPAP